MSRVQRLISMLEAAQEFTQGVGLALGALKMAVEALQAVRGRELWAQICGLTTEM